MGATILAGVLLLMILLFIAIFMWDLYGDYKENKARTKNIVRNYGGFNVKIIITPAEDKSGHWKVNYVAENHYPVRGEFYLTGANPSIEEQLKNHIESHVVGYIDQLKLEKEISELS